MRALSAWTSARTARDSKWLPAASWSSSTPARRASLSFFNLRDGDDIATKTHADLQRARIHATVHPERKSAFTKPNPLFGE